MVDQLLRDGQEVVIVTRHPEKVAEFIQRGAGLIEGSIDNPLVLNHAFNRSDAVFWLTPFVGREDYMDWARQTGRAAAEAVHRNGVRKAVVISSVGAQHETGVGPIGVLPAIETAFKAAAPNVACLRAGSFMENFLSSVGTIATQGTIFGPHPASKKIPMVATRDIAARAAELLLDESWSGFNTLGVHGPEDLDHVTAAQMISQGIGQSVQYVKVTIEQAKAGMLGAGMPPVMVDLLGELYAGFREGRMERAEPRSADTTTKTSLLEFSRQVLKPLVEATVTQ